MKVLLTYRNYRDGFSGVDPKTTFLKRSVDVLSIIGDNNEPIAKPVDIY